jgi:hypothetical protein
VFIKFRLFGPKTSDVLIKTIKTISRLDVRPGETTCVDVTHVYHLLSGGPSLWSPSIYRNVRRIQGFGEYEDEGYLHQKKEADMKLIFQQNKSSQDLTVRNRGRLKSCYAGLQYY